MATSEKKNVKKKLLPKKLFQNGIHMKILIMKLTRKIISNLHLKYAALIYNKLG